MHATTVKNKITQRDNYKEIMSAIVVVLLLTLTLMGSPQNSEKIVR
ncbi:two-component system connector SafA [Escherichia coli]|nr:hypothetical protein [Escherichia coli]EGO4346153.1 hypothetical protein [Escherichia coli]